MPDILGLASKSKLTDLIKRILPVGIAPAPSKIPGPRTRIKGTSKAPKVFNLRPDDRRMWNIISGNSVPCFKEQ